MSTSKTRETAIICAAAVAVAAVLSLPFILGGSDSNTSYLVWIVLVVVSGLAVTLRYRYLTAKNNAESEVAGAEQYRQLADEYRRLADMALTTQEHTDLKLGDIGVQLDHLREQVEALQKILKDVE